MKRRREGLTHKRQEEGLRKKNFEKEVLWRKVCLELKEETKIVVGGREKRKQMRHWIYISQWLKNSYTCFQKLANEKEEKHIFLAIELTSIDGQKS